MELCSIDHCVKASDVRSFCKAHYARLLRTGSPTGTTAPSVEERFWAKVNKADGCWNWNGHRQPKGYGTFRNGAMVLAHRYSFELANGDIPDEMQVDHKCHNRACVNPTHLRLATNKQNGENKSGPPTNNTSGILGVCWSKHANRWQAKVRHNRKYFHVGYFADRREAEEAVVAKRLELFTHNDLDRATA